MKTEGLSWTEAAEAYFVKRMKVKDNYGDSFWINENGSPQNDRGYQNIAFPTDRCAPFSISLPEEKSLTFEEAVQCERIKIHWPPTLTFPGTTGVYLKSGAWNLDEIAAIDLAERRGWKITEIKDE